MEQQGESRRQPNVLIIHTDQQRYDSLGCTGNRYALTPHIDRLASQGTLFHRHISAHPVCMPSRASFFTGRYPNGHGVYANGVAIPRGSQITEHPMNGGQSISPNTISHVPTMADVFGESGYRTASIGKLHFTCTNAPRSSHFEESRIRWAEEDMDTWSGPYYGFEQVQMTIGHGENYTGHYGKWLEREYQDVVAKVRSGEYRGNSSNHGLLYPSVVPVEAHSSTWIADRAISYLSHTAGEDKPFFLFLGFPDPHFPFTPPTELADLFAGQEIMPAYERKQGAGEILGSQRQLYQEEAIQYSQRYGSDFIGLARQYTDAMIHLIDRSVGRILSVLEQFDLADDTIILFTSDHGEYLGDYGLVFKSEHGCKALNHIPLIMKVPQTVDVWPKTCDAAVSNVDILPSLCDLVGIQAPAGVQGRSILPLLQGTRLSHPVQVTCYGDKPSDHNFSLWNDQYRYTWYPSTGECELYDHLTDPYETDNIAGTKQAAPIQTAMHLQLLELHCHTDHPSAGKVSNW
ncbi:sulfatase family protein [Paenibacillus germinis]|nr:sulfatase-like hydrolase/transferase [Paenibacillus germinis]